MSIFKKVYNGLKGLLTGMALTFKYFISFDKVITQQYPENRATLKLPSRSRAKIELVFNEQTGNFSCIACGLCARACPNNSIEVIRVKDPITNKPKLDKFIYHLERCVVCGLCIDACKSNALKWDSKFENSVYDPSQLTIVLNELPTSFRKRENVKIEEPIRAIETNTMLEKVVEGKSQLNTKASTS